MNLKMKILEETLSPSGDFKISTYYHPDNIKTVIQYVSTNKIVMTCNYNTYYHGVFNYMYHDWIITYMSITGTLIFHNLHTNERTSYDISNCHHFEMLKTENRCLLLCSRIDNYDHQLYLALFDFSNFQYELKEVPIEKIPICPVTGTFHFMNSNEQCTIVVKSIEYVNQETNEKVDIIFSDHSNVKEYSILSHHVLDEIIKK